jgi:hypothetical protein
VGENLPPKEFFKEFLRRETDQKNAFAAIKLFFPRSPVFHFFRREKFQIYPKIRTKSADLSSVWGAGARISRGKGVMDLPHSRNEMRGVQISIGDHGCVAKTNTSIEDSIRDHLRKQ